MNVKVFITIDTEEDDWGDFHKTIGSVENVKALPKLQSLFNKYGAIPTYLVNYPVASQKTSIEILSSFQSEGFCEIGTHCHPWNTPPLTEDLNPKTSMMCNLHYNLLIEKMRYLHNTIKDNFNCEPVSFRAGRWAFSEDVAKCLVELGYLVDTSMTPFVDWSSFHGPNFNHSTTKPFYFNSENIFIPVSGGELFELPPTIGFCQSNFRLCNYVQNKISKGMFSKFRLLGILDRLKLLNFYWLSPELSSGTQMINLSKRFVELGHQHLNMSFHSTSMLPGKNPFVTNKRELLEFLDKIEVFLKYATKNGYEFLPLSQSTNLIE